MEECVKTIEIEGITELLIFINKMFEIDLVLEFNLYPNVGSMLNNYVGKNVVINSIFIDTLLNSIDFDNFLNNVDFDNCHFDDYIFGLMTRIILSFFLFDKLPEKIIRCKSCIEEIKETDEYKKKKKIIEDREIEAKKLKQLEKENKKFAAEKLLTDKKLKLEEEKNKQLEEENKKMEEMKVKIDEKDNFINELKEQIITSDKEKKEELEKQIQKWENEKDDIMEKLVGMPPEDATYKYLKFTRNRVMNMVLKLCKKHEEIFERLRKEHWDQKDLRSKNIQEKMAPEFTNKINDLESIIKEFEINVEKLQEKSEFLEKTIEKLKKDMKKLQDDKEKLKNEKQELTEQKGKEMQEFIEAKDREIKALNDLKNKESLVKNREIQKLVDMIHELQEENKILKNKIENIKTAIEVKKDKPHKTIKEFEEIVLMEDEKRQIREMKNINEVKRNYLLENIENVKISESRFKEKVQEKLPKNAPIKVIELETLKSLEIFLSLFGLNPSKRNKNKLEILKNECGI